MDGRVGRASPLAWWAAVFAAALILLAPLLIAPIPPVSDYPGHLARLYVLAHGTHDPNLSAMYAPDWHIIPNLAIDLIVPPMLRVLPMTVAGQIALAVTLLLPLAGVLALHRALHGYRSWWPLISCLIAYNAIFMLGFMNYLIGIGAALLVTAAWLVLRRQSRVASTVALATGATMVFFCHILPLAFLGVLIGCLLLGELWLAWRQQVATWRLAFSMALQLAGGFAIPALLYMSSRFSSAHGALIWSTPKLKLTELLAPVLAYHPVLDGAAALTIAAVLAISYWRRRLAAHPVMPPGIALAIAVVLLAFAVAPFGTKGGTWADARLPIMLACLLIAGLAPPPMPRAAAITFTLAVIALLLLRTAGVAAIWHSYNGEIAHLQRVLAAVPPGSRVLLVRVDPDAHKKAWHRVPLGRRLVGFGSADSHVAGLLLTLHGSFTQDMFANPSQQPLRVLPPYDQLRTAVAVDFPNIEALQPGPIQTAELADHSYLKDWQDRFDFLFVTEPADAPDPAAATPNLLEPLGRCGIGELYRIQHKTRETTP